jgi:hypothetical protein
MRSYPVHGEMYLIQHDVIKFISDLRQAGGLLITGKVNIKGFGFG